VQEPTARPGAGLQALQGVEITQVNFLGSSNMLQSLEVCTRASNGCGVMCDGLVSARFASWLDSSRWSI
jgi:hypothetical protein